MEKIKELRRAIIDLVNRITNEKDLKLIYRLVNRLFCRR